MQRIVDELAMSRQWVIGPPVFLNEEETDNEAGVMRTIGGYHDM
jgi:hypothetical protein